MGAAASTKRAAAPISCAGWSFHFPTHRRGCGDRAKLAPRPHCKEFNLGGRRATKFTQASRRGVIPGAVGHNYPEDHQTAPRAREANSILQRMDCSPNCQPVREAKSDWLRRLNNPRNPRGPGVNRSRYSPSGDAFGSPALSISAPIFLETFGACPLVCGAGTPGVSVAASGTVAMAGLFGVELWNSGGELVGSDG